MYVAINEANVLQGYTFKCSFRAL